MREIIKLNIEEALTKNGIRYDKDFALLMVSRDYLSRVVSTPLILDYITCFVCTKGNMELKYDDEIVKIRPHTIFICVKSKTTTIQQFSSDLEGYTIIMSDKFVNSLLIQASSSVYHTVHLPINDIHMEISRDFYHQADTILNLPIDRRNRIEAMRHLILMNLSIIDSGNEATCKDDLISDNKVVRQFLLLLQNNYKKEHRVEFYSNALNRNTQYLSRMMKNLSGKTVPEWIDNYLETEAKNLLTNTTLTIQQVSDELNFTSQSSFGKFFKRVTGISPKIFRRGVKK